jgi:hypothetical protein
MAERASRQRVLECGPAKRVRSSRAMWTDDEPPAVVVFCPECAEREFDD